MPFAFRKFATMSFSTLRGLGSLVLLAITASRASGGQFEPIKEAEMPQGFPRYTPVGQIEIKHYPAYRKARASGASEFWTLFGHINRNNVKMTAPVEMDYGDPRGENSTRRLMSFLYERPDQGIVGKQGSIEVIDVPAMTIVSIGCRGDQTLAAVAEARDRLLKYLLENNREYVAAGPMRVMGHNSPFVPRDRNYFEVQIPVKPAKSV